MEKEEEQKQEQENDMTLDSIVEVPIEDNDDNDNDAKALTAAAEIKQLREDLRRSKDASENTMNKMKYLMADFDNYRKQMEKQLASRAESIKAELLLKFLNIRDDFLRAIAVARQSKSEPVVIQGLEGIMKNIDSLLSSEGVVEIETEGTPFDPNVHDAVAYSAKDDVPENTVTSEIRKGYMLNGKVLRPSLVEVSKKIVKNSVSDSNNPTDTTTNQGD
ncbi:MAG TPA: nucleotide exchange factor GrpE [Nitrososphaera sp.]|nr:nucleotide exchange factor GrpE [Nitrososphaera sp.]